MSISSLNDIKQGLTILYNDEPYIVLEAHFVRMQQRKPVMQTKLKNLINGKVVEHNFKPGDKVQEASVTKKNARFLYKDQSEAHFMDNETYEQFSLPYTLIANNSLFLKEGIEVTLLCFKENPIGIKLPVKMDFKVTAAPPGVRGDSAQGRITKTATIETGLTLDVPLFIKEGEIIRINTETGEYVERVQEKK